MIVERGADDLALVLGAIDRTEHVDIRYEVVDGALRECPVAVADIPTWSAERVASHVPFCAEAIERGGHALVAMNSDAGAATVSVSALPSGSAVGFSLPRGCRLADPPHPELFAPEPDDIHLVCDL